MPPTADRLSPLARSRFVAAGAAFATAVLARPTRAFGQEATPIHLANSQVEGQSEGYYAQDAGIFAKAGLTADFLPVRGGAAGVAAVVGGAVQVGCTNPVSLGQALQRGIPLVMVAVGAIWDTKVPSGFAIVAPNSPIKTAKDLNGSVIGIPSLGGLNQLIMTAYIKRGGGDPSTVKFTEIPESTTVDALLGGRIAASYLDDPQYSAAKSQIRPLAAASDAIADTKPFAETVWFSTKDWVAANPALARRIVGCLIDGGKWAMANPEAAAKVIETRLSFKEAKAKIRFATANDPQVVQPLLDTATELKVLPPIRAAEFFWDGKVGADALR